MIKNYIILLFLLGLLCPSIFAQTVIINTGTAGTPQYNAGPIYRSSAGSAYDASRYSYLYTQTELAAAGITSGASINQLGWVKNNAATSLGIGGIVRIYIKNSTTASYSSATETWANLNAGTTMVYENLSFTVPATATPTYITFPFISPFTYNGGSLEISVEWDINQVTGSPSTGTFDWLWSTVPDRIYGNGNTTLAGITTLSKTTNSISDITNRRPFIQISYTPGGPCTNPPNAGTATTNNAGPVCPNSTILLNLSGNSTGTGMTYEWESSPTLTPFVPTSISTPASAAALTINPTITRYYRAKVVCNNATPAFSTPVLVTVAGGLPGNTYTINGALPTAGLNYNSFADAIDALECGILGPVTFNVAPNSGPYVETINIPSVLGTSAINTIKFNGNGNTVQFNNTATERQMLTFDGAKYVKIDSLTFKTLDATYGWGALVTNGSVHDSITNCVFDLTATTSTSSANTSGICFSSSNTSATATGINGSHCYIGNNKLYAATGSGGAYYALTLCGASDSNIVENNLFQNYYFYGIYINDATGSKILNNELQRATKTTTTTFYGIYSTGVTPGTIISGNRIHSSGGVTPNTSLSYCIYLLGDGTAAQPNMVSNNAIYNITQGGTIYGIYLSATPYTKVYHNTVTIDQVLTGTSANYGIYATGTNNDLDIINNNVSITAGTDGAKYGFYYSTVASVNNAQRNNYYVNSTQAGAQNYGYYTTAYADMAAFQTAYPTFELGSVSDNPQFVNAATGNLTPTNFTLYGTGQNLNTQVPRDINGTLRLPTPVPGAFEMPLPPINNAGTVALVDPQGALCPGTYPVSISIINAGLNTLNNAQVNWQVNGVNQPSIAYTGPLVAATVIGGQNVDTVLLGNVTLSAGMPLLIKTWTSLPNGVADTDNSNDTLTFTLTTAMSGAYTINGAAPTSGNNYQTFAAFTDDLMLKGVCGPVVADVNPAAGPYDEVVSFGNIVGTSPINTVTVKGHGANVEFNNTITARQMLTFSGTKYVKVDSLNFKTLNTTYGWAAIITNGSAYDSVTNCVFDLTATTSTASASTSGICFTASTTSAITAGNNGSHCYIGGNKLWAPTGSGGAYYALTICGESDSNIIENNLLQNYYFYGIYINGAAGSKILNNELERATKTTTTTFYGIYSTGVTPNTVISGNRIHSTGGVTPNTSVTYCIYLLGDGTATEPNLVSNNAVYNITQGGTIYGIYLSTAPHTKVYHNTVTIDQLLTGTSANYGMYATGTNTGVEFKNNNVSITGGTLGTKYGFYYGTAASVDDAQRNNIYVNSTQTGTQNYGYYTTAYADINAFQLAYPTLELGSLSVNPQFLSATTGNLLPLNPLLATNGNNLLTEVAQDIIGVTRSTTPTPGAFELAANMLNNAGATTLVNPNGVFCSGPRQLEATIANFGINDISSVDVNWSVNGVLQTAVNYSTIIGNVYSANNTATINLGLATFPAGTTSIVKVWTSMPNLLADTDNSNDTLTIAVTPSYSVTVNLGSDTSICAGQNLALDAGNTGASYLWSNGATTQNTSFNTPGNHYVIVTAADACIGTDSIQLTVNSLPIVNLGNDTAICPGVILSLNAGNSGATYLWNDGTTSQTNDASVEGTYSVAVTDNNGCVGTDAIFVNLIDAPLADGINATYSDEATYTFYPINPQFSNVYVWNFGDGSPEVSGQFVQHTYTQNGIYTVTCTMEGICNGSLVDIARTVDVFDAGTTGIKDRTLNQQVQLYPNPALTKVTIHSMGGVIEDVHVYNVAGQHIWMAKGSSDKMTIDVHNWAAGVYVVKVKTAEGLVVKKIEILK